MLVLDGRPVELEAHMERLSLSLRSLFGIDLPRETRESVLDGARPVEHGKLRITIVPRPDGSPTTAIATTPVERPLVFPDPTGAVVLRTVVVDGGLGEHKWADRDLLERAEAGAPAGVVPLLVDRDGWVLEAARGSVFAPRDGRLLTPPTDGRILPGIARRRVIEVADSLGIETREGPLALADLRAGEAFLAGSVRGIEPVRSVDRFELDPVGALSPAIAARLKRRWLPVPEAATAASVAIGRRADPLAR